MFEYLEAHERSPRRLGRRREGKGGGGVTNINLAYVEILFKTLKETVEKTLALAGQFLWVTPKPFQLSLWDLMSWMEFWLKLLPYGHCVFRMELSSFSI